MNTNTTTKESRVRLSSLPDICKQITPDMVMIAEDCNSYNASFFCNGQWQKPCFQGDFQGCFLQSVGDRQVLRFYYISTELEGLAYDERPEDWDDEDAPEMPEMTTTGMTEYKQVWIDQKGHADVINLDNGICTQYNEETFVCVPDSLQPWIYEPNVKNLILNLVNEHEDYENDFSLTYHLSPTGELLSKQAPQFNKCILSLYRTNDATSLYRTFRVALRHHYQLPTDNATTRLYLDYLRMLNDINEGHMTNPKFICPDNILEAHDRLARRRDKIKAEKERREAARMEAEFREQHAWLFGIEFDNDHFHFKSLDSVEEYRREGEIMHHCIYRMKYFNKHDYLSMHISDLEGNRVATCTIDLARRSIEQIQTICNDPQWREGNEYKEIWNVLMARMHTFPKRKKQTTSNRKVA